MYKPKLNQPNYVWYGMDMYTSYIQLNGQFKLNKSLQKISRFCFLMSFAHLFILLFFCSRA